MLLCALRERCRVRTLPPFLGGDPRGRAASGRLPSVLPLLQTGVAAAPQPTASPHVRHRALVTDRLVRLPHFLHGVIEKRIQTGAEVRGQLQDFRPGILRIGGLLEESAAEWPHSGICPPSRHFSPRSYISTHPCVAPAYWRARDASADPNTRQNRSPYCGRRPAANAARWCRSCGGRRGAAR